jgi:hypothetical protein
VTATHTTGVFALGLTALLASRYVLAEQLFPWPAAVYGLIVIADCYVFAAHGVRAVAADRLQPRVGRWLTGVGLLFLQGSQLLQDASGVAAVSRYIPAVSAMVIFILSVGITVEAMWRLASVV